MPTLKKVMPWLLGVVAVALVLNACTSAPSYKGPASEHFDGKVFKNTIPSDKSIWDITRLFTGFYFHKDSWPGWVDADFDPLARASEISPRSEDLQITFINHSTVLIQVDGVNILTDPIFTNRASPLSFAGPKRVRAPGIPLDRLPHIDVILISHNHYDHLDIESLKMLNQRQLQAPPLIVAGLGNGLYFQEEGLSLYKDLDWNQRTSFNEVGFTFTECRHRSGRGMMDQMRTLWGSFVIHTSRGNLYFAGDTGYGHHFKEARQQFGDFEVALLPIGAYEPRWFMQAVHLNPDDAVRAHLDLAAKLSLSIHFGTFQLTHEGINQPVKDLDQARLEHGVAESEFLVLKFGETLLFN